jgi:hypothetical protein
VNVAGIVTYRDCVGIGDGARTAKPAAFVNPDSRKAPTGKAFGKELVRRTVHTESIIAIAVSGA